MRNRNDGVVREKCFACGMTRAIERHHPLRVANSNLTVPLCLGCHGMVDRQPLDDWNPEEAWLGLSSLVSRSTPLERLVLLKMWGIFGDEMTAMKKIEVPYGFRRTRAGTLVKDAAEQLVLSAIHSALDAGLTIAEIACELEVAGIKAKEKAA